jgi:hypothetical protein
LSKPVETLQSLQNQTMNWRRTLSIMRKEWWHVTRDRTSFFLLMLSPVFALVTMGYAFSVDIKNVRIEALDQDRSPLSRTYLAELASTQALRLEARPESLDEVEDLMSRGRIKAAVIMPPGLERAWYNPSLRHTVSMILALVGAVLSVPAMATSLTLAREREWGDARGFDRNVDRSD